MKKYIIIVSLTVAHAIISYGLLIISFSNTMSRFDTGNLQTLNQKIIDVISIILLCPVFYPIARWGGTMFQGILGYIPLLINSLIWALVIYWVFKKIKKMVLTNHFTERS